MVDRDDILTELGLAPAWRLRARAGNVATAVIDAAERGDPHVAREGGGRGRSGSPLCADCDARVA